MIALLDNFDSACNYFDSFEESLGTVGEEPAPLPEKTLLGPYKIQHEIGRGGMSYVYLAERTDGMYEEKVAIKVLKKGLDTSAILNRFQKESQLLVNLRHSGIANLLDGGQTNDGQPYLVMEYIEGKPLDEALGKNALTLKDRLKLFLQIINAVQHAHSQLVVHRDLKPGNILVTNDNQVKLLDFGIAKLLVNSHENEFTQQGQRLFTPEYASPEQLAGERISTATDV
ncbi:MAG: serine/threonine protein kinase, partial [Bacteroidetes bacterium]|nr:serine/threonine protein kinase [Bacteroidota bacterium]